jgi:hypothetical protein
MYWTKRVSDPSAGQEQLNRDNFDCLMIGRNSAVQRPNPYQGWFDEPVPNEATQRVAIYELCMSSRGYNEEWR